MQSVYLQEVTRRGYRKKYKGRNSLRDVNSLGACRSTLWQLQVQDAVVVLGLDLVGVDIIRNRDSARELAESSFRVSHIVVTVFVAAFGFTRECKLVAVHIDVDIFLSDTGKIAVDVESIVALGDIDSRIQLTDIEAVECSGAVGIPQTFKEVVHAAFETVNSVVGSTPVDHRHSVWIINVTEHTCNQTSQPLYTLLPGGLRISKVFCHNDIFVTALLEFSFPVSCFLNDSLTHGPVLRDSFCMH